MESKDYFDAMSVATNNAEKKTKKKVYDSAGKTANLDSREDYIYN